MAQRPIQHINEEKSRRAFSDAIPPEWVIRNQDIDYGIDSKVDIFIDNKLTPYTFCVQLKSIDKVTTLSDTLKYPFKTERILDYMDSFIPVMLVVYDVVNDRLAYKWVEAKNEVVFEEIRKLTLQKTITIKFDNYLNNKTPRKLYKEVVSESLKRRLVDDINIKYNIALIFDENNDDKKILINEYIEWMKINHYSNKIGIDYNINENTDGIFFINECLAIGTKEKKYLNVDLEIFAFKHKLLILEIMTSILLLISGHLNTSLDIIRNTIFLHKADLKEIETFLCYSEIAKTFIKQNREFEAFKIAECLIENDLNDAAMIFATSLINSNKVDYFCGQEFRRILEICIRKTKNEKLKGVYHYNLANNLSAHGYKREAIKNFLIAKKLNMSYDAKSYWWSELAGCLFLIGKYKWSNKCYEKALELKEPHCRIKALNADALLFQGNINDAIEMLDSYLEETDYPIVEYQLKKIMLGHLKKYSSNEKRNSKLSLELVEKGLIENSSIKSRLIFERAIKVDPLCGLAWFNFSISEGENNQFLNWLTTSLIQNWDIEACCNSFISIFKNINEYDADLFNGIIFYYYSIHGDDFIDAVISRFMWNDETYTKYFCEEISLLIKKTYEDFNKIYGCQDEFIYRTILN